MTQGSLAYEGDGLVSLWSGCLLRFYLNHVISNVRRELRETREKGEYTLLVAEGLSQLCPDLFHL